MVHGNRGRPCKYNLKDQILKRGRELARGKYRGFNGLEKGPIATAPKLSLFKYQRPVADEHCQFRRRVVQIPKHSPSRSYAGKRINVFKGEKIARFDFKTACTFRLSNEQQTEDVPLWTLTGL